MQPLVAVPHQPDHREGEDTMTLLLKMLAFVLGWGFLVRALLSASG